MNYTRSRIERETVIRFDEFDRTAHIYTASPAVIRRLDRLAAALPTVYRCIWREDGDTAARFVLSDCRLIRFGRPASDRQKAAARANLNSRPQNTPTGGQFLEAEDAGKVNPLLRG